MKRGMRNEPLPSPPVRPRRSRPPPHPALGSPRGKSRKATPTDRGPLERIPLEKVPNRDQQAVSIRDIQQVSNQDARHRPDSGIAEPSRRGTFPRRDFRQQVSNPDELARGGEPPTGREPRTMPTAACPSNELRPLGLGPEQPDHSPQLTRRSPFLWGVPHRLAMGSSSNPGYGDFWTGNPTRLGHRSTPARTPPQDLEPASTSQHLAVVHILDATFHHSAFSFRESTPAPKVAAESSR